MGVKVGDKIKLLRDDTFGAYKRGDIVNVRGLVDGGVYFDDNDGDERCASSEWFEPVAVADSNGKERGEFKVGDRVRVVRLGTEDGGSFHPAKIGDEFTVTKIYDEPEAEIHTDKWSFYPHEIEPVAVAPQPQPPLTITAGKFYRTRDGRKVGPAQDRGSYFNLDGWDYNASGICGRGGRANEEDYRRKHDLIAEWTDEPAVPLYDPRTDAFSGTTGFTVPLDAPEFGGGARFKVGDRVEIVGCTGCKTRFNGSQFTIDSDEGDFGGEKSWSGKDNKSPYRFKESELRLVAEATSSKDEPELPIVYKDGKFYVRAAHIVVENDDEPVTSIADIVRRLEALEDKANGGKIKIGGSVTLDAPAKVTGIDKHSVNIVLASGGSYALPLAALRAA